MQDHLEQRLDKLAKKVVKSSKLESPSLDFTAKVMQQVEASNISYITVYKPLISKRAWYVIATLIIGGISYAIFGGTQSSPWLEGVDLSIISNNQVTEAISNFSVSKIVSYAIGFGGLAWFIQITLTKHLLDKKLQF